MTPDVKVSGIDHVLLVPSMTAVPAGESRESRGQLAGYRNDIVAALDLLFLGV